MKNDVKNVMDIQEQLKLAQAKLQEHTQTLNTKIELVQKSKEEDAKKNETKAETSQAQAAPSSGESDQDVREKYIELAKSLAEIKKAQIGADDEKKMTY